MGADLDAYRRHRHESPGPASVLAAHVAALTGSDQPQVVFARLADLAAAVLCDACEVEVDDGSGSRFHLRAEDDAAPRTGRDPESHDAATELHLALSGPGRGQHPPYAGIVTFSWWSRRPDVAEEVAATLAVRHAETLVDHERLLNLLGAAEGRAAEAAVSAITTRSINLATGIAMHQYGATEEVGEDLLRQSATANGRTLYGAAARAVRRRAFDDHQPGPRSPVVDTRPFPRRVDLEAPDPDRTSES